MQGDVLYLALEDSQRRLQDRTTKLLPFSSEWPENLTLATKWRRADQGGLDDIREWVEDTRAAGRKVAFIAVDVLKMIRPTANRIKSAYEADYDALVGLRELAIDLEVAIIVTHHTRKAEAEDLIDKVSGTFGLAGAADTVIIIEWQSGNWIFDVRRRDVAADQLAAKFDKATFRWTILGNAAEVHGSAERNEQKEEGVPYASNAGRGSDRGARSARYGDQAKRHGYGARGSERHGDVRLQNRLPGRTRRRQRRRRYPGMATGLEAGKGDRDERHGR